MSVNSTRLPGVLPHRELRPRLMLGAVLLTVLSTSIAFAAPARRATVTDSIAMTRIIDPDAIAAATGGLVPDDKISPNGRYFAIVTRSGNVKERRNDYALVVFDTKEILAFVNGPADAASPADRTLVQMSSTSNDDAIDHVRWLADNNSLVFLGHEGDRPRQVYSIDVTSGTLRQLTNHPRSVSAFALNTTSDVLIYAASVDAPFDEYDEPSFVVGTMNIHEVMYADRDNDMRRYRPRHQFYAASWANGANARTLGSSFDGEAPDEIALSPDGGWAVTLIDPQSETPPWRARYRAIDQHPLIDAMLGEFDAQTMKPSDAFKQFLLIDVEGGSAIPVFDAPTGRYFAGPAVDAHWLPDSRHVILANTFLPLDVADQAERERRQAPAIVELEVASGQLERITDLSVARRGLERGESFGGATLDVDGNVLTIKRYSPRGPLPMKAFRRHGNRWIETNPPEKGTRLDSSGHLSIAVRQDLNTPPELEAHDLKTGRKRIITDLNPQFRELAFGNVELFNWRDAKNRGWTAGLVYPPDFHRGQRRPLVIQTHGFNPGEFLIDGAYGATSAFAAQALAAKGIMVLQLPNRYDEGVNVPAEIALMRAGIESAIDALDAAGLIDRTRIGMIGWSHTGLYVQEMFVFSSYPIAAATISDATNVTTFGYVDQFGSHAPGMLITERLLGAQPWGEGLETWIARSPQFHLDRVRTPLRLEQNGIYLNRWWDIYALLRRQHKPAEMIVLPRGTHVLIKPEERLASQQGNVDWFAFWLKDEEDPDPSKAEQYQRWRKLRDQRDAVLGESAIASKPEIKSASYPSTRTTRSNPHLNPRDDRSSLLAR